MKIFSISSTSYQITPASTDTIHLYTQFFIPKDKTRLQELQYCLRTNTSKPDIGYIHLLGERLYSENELGVRSDKIIQTVIGKRLRFQDVFSYIRTQGVHGFHILLNSDICFSDEGLQNLRGSELSTHKKMYALLRHEYISADLRKCPIFGPRFDSQDTWIFHSNFMIQADHESAFGFHFGQPGCDNKMVYLMRVLGYEVLNDPAFIPTFHVHSSKARNYTIKDAVPQPWGVVVPAGYNPLQMPVCLGIDLRAISIFANGLQSIQFEDNSKLHDYIASKISEKKQFIIPRISGIENNIAVYARIMKERSSTLPPQLLEYIRNVIPAMKNNAGIQLSSIQSVIHYSDEYLRAFEQCDFFAGWDLQGNYIGHIAQSHDYMQRAYVPTRTMFWSLALDVFHYIYATPWTRALRGQRILIISPFEDTLREKIPIRAKIYDGVDLFPDCEITVLKPPQTQAGEFSREFDKELVEFKRRVDDVLDTFDVALVSCGGYANPICAHIFEKGKSAIYVGGVLQMYFGILGARWVKERPDIVRLFLNEHWSRPKESERPKNSKNVEGGCYW
jgi:hypothetical protein